MLTRAETSEMLLSTLILAAALSTNVALVVQEEEQMLEKKAQFKLNSLPEPFTNEKLPASKGPMKEATNEKCFRMIGCYEEIPIVAPKQDPLNLASEFRVYHRGNRDEAKLIRFGNYATIFNSGEMNDNYPFDMNELMLSEFNPNRRTIVLISGYLSESKTDWELIIKDLWLRLDDVNVIIVGWSYGNHGLYGTAAINTRAIARHLTVLLYYFSQLFNLKLDDDAFTNNLYIIGHSLGAHIAGFVGQDFGGRVGRITGLDPAGPQFDNLSRDFRLDRSDAQLVDALHTNAGATLLPTHMQYGSALASSHVDLYANDGKHQISCSGDLLGCSHCKAYAYYDAFLKHELSMRQYLGCESNCSLYRLRAYASDSFEDFRNGMSLKRKCPVTVMSDENSLHRDLESCSIPIDYVSWFHKLREELETKNGIDFSIKNDNLANKYYFYTNLNTDEQSDHYLVKIRLAKNFRNQVERLEEDFATILQPMGNLRHQDSPPIGCNFNIHIQSSNGMVYKNAYSNYEPVNTMDYFEIILPYLSPNLVSKSELAKLDLEDYYLNATDSVYRSMRSKLDKVLPLSVTIQGLGPGAVGKNREEEKENKGVAKRVLDWAKSWWSSSSESEKKQKVGEEQILDSRCILPIDSVTITPLRKMHRDLVASYTPQRMMQPSVIVLARDEANLVETTKVEREFKMSSLSDPWESKPDCWDHYLCDVKIGPYDSSIDPKPVEPVKEAEETGVKSKKVFLDGPGNQPKEPQISRSYSLSASIVVITSIIVVTVVVLIARARPWIRHDENRLISPRSSIMQLTEVDSMQEA